MDIFQVVIKYCSEAELLFDNGNEGDKKKKFVKQAVDDFLKANGQYEKYNEVADDIIDLIVAIGKNKLVINLGKKIKKCCVL